MLKNVVYVVCLCILLGACASSEEKSVDLYEKALAYYEAGNLPEARIEAKNAIKLDPKNAQAFMLLGDCAIQDQNWRGAFGAYGQAVQLDPSLTKAQLGLGRIYLLSRQFDKADEIATLILETEPKNTEAHLLRAGTMLQKGDYDGALRILQAVLAEDPENSDATLGLVTSYERKGDMVKAHLELTRAIKRNPANIAIRYKAASMAEKAEDYPMAEAHYLKLLEVSPQKAPVQLMIARLHEKSGDMDKAEKTLQTLTESDPENLDYKLGLTGFYLRSKEYDKSLATIAAMLNENPDDIRIELARVDVLIAKKDLDEAKTSLVDITERYPDHPLTAQALSKLGALHIQEKDFPQAIACLDDAIQRSSSPEFMFLRARARLGAQDVEGAIADLRIVRKELPDNYEARYLLARAYLAQDKGLMAVEELHEILDRNADYSPSRNLLVKYYARYGQWELAQEELQKLIEQTPDDPSLLMALGDVKRMKGDTDTAVTYYERVLELPTGHGPALLRLGMMAESEKRFTDAIAYYDQVIQIHPKSAAAIERKLFTLSAAGNSKKLDAYKTALLKTMPDSPVLHDIFGRICLTQKDTATAEKEFRMASEIAPEWGVPYQRLIGIYLANKQMDKVVHQCEQALEKNPDAFVEEFLLGQIYQLQGETDKATTAYNSVLTKKPDFMPAANNLAYMYAENHTDTETLEKALKLAQVAAAKGNPEALDTLGWVYHLLGNREQSIETLHKAYEEMPDNKTIAYHLATVLAKWSYTSEARRIAENALTGDVQFPERKQMTELLNTL